MAQQVVRQARKNRRTKMTSHILVLYCIALRMHTAHSDETVYAGEEEEEEEEEENDFDRAFIDDNVVESQSHYRDIDSTPQQTFRRVGMDDPVEDDSKQKNKDRQEPRTLLPSTERANYGDLAEQPGCENYMFMLPCITNRAVPYNFLLQTNAVACEGNEYLLPDHLEYLQGPSMRQHARLFGIRPPLCSLTLGAHQEEQELRQLNRMVKQGDDDPFHKPTVTATDKMLYANQVLQPHNGLDCSTSDLGGEWPVQMDANTSSKMLHGRHHGGIKGADTTLSLFTIRKLIDMKNDEDLMLIQNAYNGYASDLTYNKKLSCPCVNTERQELFHQYGNSKIVRDVNIKIENRYQDKDTRRDSLSYVDPVILEKISSARGLHGVDLATLGDAHLSKLMLDCRSEPLRARQEEENLSLHNFLTSHIHVIPCRVRDKEGKNHTVVVEVLRICAHIEACDPAVSLVQMISSGGHCLQDPLLRVTNNMARMLELGPMNMTNMFSCNAGAENIATLGLDANIPLAFFLYLKQNGFSTYEASPFAADFQCCRIDVYNPVEVKMYNKYLEILKHSRRKQFQIIRTETQRDYQPGSRCSHLPIKTKNWDFQNFFSGIFYMAIPKTVYKENVECVRQILSTRPDVDWQKFEDQKEEFEQAMSDDSHVYVGVHGYPVVSGYICEFNQSCSKEEELRSHKKRKTSETESTKNVESSVVPLYLWSSPAYQLFMANACQDADPFDRFIDSTAPDNPDYYSLQKRSTSLTVTESNLWNIMKVKNRSSNKLNKFQSIANQVLKHYGVKGHEMHDTLKDISKTSETSVILPNMHESVQHYIKAWIESSTSMPMVALARGAQSLKQIARLYAEEAGNTRIIKDYLLLARRCTNQVEAAVNDDAIVSAIYLLNTQAIDIGLNFINEMTKRWMVGAAISIWCESHKFSPYCYPVQPCDAGGFDVYTAPSKNHNHWKKQVDDAGRWGRGKDTTFQEVGVTMNAYARHCLPDQETRASYIANPGVENLDKATPMTLARQTAVVMNNGSINAEVSDHELSFGRIVAFLEVAKCVAEPKLLLLLWAEFERFVGSSGQGTGTQQDRYKTSQHMAQLNFYHTNEGPAVCFASNAISQNQFESFVRGCRCNRTPCGTSDSTGCFTWNVLPVAAGSAPVQHRKRKRKAKDTEDSNFALKGVHVLKQDDVFANEAYYLLEHLNRMFSFMHRGLCLDRVKFSRYSWIDMDCLREASLSLTAYIAKPVYSAKDIRARNFDGAFETAMMGKWTRHVIHGAFYRRMLLSRVDDEDKTHCQIEHVMLDAVKAFLFVPISLSAVLSAMQLYFALVLLDIALMIITCMNLYYLQMKNGCPLHILACVAQEQEKHLSHAELQTYHQFAEFLVNAVCTDRVMQKSIPEAFSEDSLRKLAMAKTVLNSAFSRIIEPDATNMPTTFVAHTFFNVDSSVNPIQEEKSAECTSNGTCEIMAAWFAQQQAQAQTEKNSAGEQFWTNAVDGCGMPQPTSSSNTAGNSSAFMKPQNCYKWYDGVIQSVGNAHGVIQKFIHICDMDQDASRLDMLLAILRVHFEKHPQQKHRFMHAVSHNGVLSPAWTAPIINEETNLVTNNVFTWTVRPREQPAAQAQQPNQVTYNGLQVSMATDILFVIVGQALYAAEWKHSELENKIVVHTRNMANAAQVLVFLMMHTAIPMAYIPAHNGVVVLSEPSHKREHNNSPVMIEYHRHLHVNHCKDKHSFLDTQKRNPKEYVKITTCHGVDLILHKQHLKANSLSTVIKKHELFTYPPESMAHMLPFLEHLRHANISHSSKKTTKPFADSAFAFSILEFGRCITAEHVMHIPSTLTDCAAREEIPCITWQHGFMFVLCVCGKNTKLYPVTPTQPDAENRFDELPLADGVQYIDFPTNQLSYAMAHGLVLDDGAVRFQPAPCGAKQVCIPSLPFLMFPIIQFDTLLLLKLGTSLETFGSDPDNTYEDLTVGLLCKHQESNAYLTHGHHCVHYYDTNKQATIDSVDFLFVSRCMLMEGHQLFLKLPLDDLPQMLKHMHDSPDNEHIGNRTFGLEADDMMDMHTHVVIKCFYTLSPDKHTTTLQEKKIRVLFSIQKQDTDACTFVFHETKLFNDDFICNFHIMPPRDETMLLLHFAWK
jgi:hypothetical protein